jgi:DNA-binding transcriptional MerR regulator
VTGEGDATSGRRPLVSVDALNATRIPVRSKWGKLFGASTTDTESARRRLVETLSGSASDRSSEGVHAEASSGGSTEGFHLSTVVDATAQNWTRQRQVLEYPVAPQAYRSEAACHAAGISHRQLDYWARTGLVKPSIRFGQPGKPNLYSFRDILLLKVIKRLLDAGISLKQARVAVQHLQRYEGDDLSLVTLMSDGVSIYELTSDDEIIALLKGNTAVFGVALDRVASEVAGALDELPSHAVASADSGAAAPKEAVASDTNPAGLEELAALRLLSKLVVDLSDEKARSVAMLLTEMRMKEKIGELADVIDFGARRSQRTGA